MADSKVVGRYAISLLLYLAEEQIRNGVDVIIESAFNYSEDYVLLQGWIDVYGVDMRTVITIAIPKISRS